MMDIVMLVAGAGVGAMLRDLFVLHRGDKNKTRQQPESKTPYDYALTNAINERDRLQDELVTIQALKRTEADTERIRDEIDTILSDGGEEASEGAYDVDKAFMDSTDLTFRQYYDVIKTTDDKRHPAARAALERERQDEVTETSAPAPWDTRIAMEEMVDNISKAIARVNGTNVREDDVEDEPLAYMSAERMYTDLLNKSSSKPRIVSVFWVNEAEDGRYWHHTSGELNGSAWTNEGLSHVTVDNECIDGDKVDLITEGDDICGETLYRKGNRYMDG